MDLRDLYYFQTIAELGHMRKAAEKLFVTQPALSRSVQRLEEEIGGALFNRIGRGIQITPLGEVLLDKARQIRMVVDSASREVKDFSDGVVGHVRLGCAPTLAKFLLPGLFEALLAEAPGVTVSIESGASISRWSMLWEGKLDLLLTPMAPGRERKGYRVEPILEDVTVVVAAEGHPIFEKEYTIHDLEKYNWVLPSLSVSMRHWLDAVMEKHGLPRIEPQIQAEGILYLPRLLARAKQLSFLSRRNVGFAEGGVRLREVVLPEVEFRRVFCLVYQEHTYHSAAVNRLIHIVRTRAQELVEPFPTS